MTSEPAAIGITERRGPTFEWRAATTFKVVVAFAATITVIVVAGTGQFPPAYLVVASVASVLCLLVAARDLDAAAPWARVAAPTLLRILIGFGVVQVVIALGASRLEFPIGAILAVWAFAAPRAVPPPVLGGSRALAVAATFLVANAALVLGPPLLGPTSPFAAGEGDLNVSLAFDCGPPGRGVPDKVPVTFHWSWSRTEPFPGGTDGIAIAWDGQDTTAVGGTADTPDAQEPGNLFILGEPQPVVGPGVWQGGASPSSDLTDVFIAGSEAGLTFGVDLAEQQFAAGDVVMTLQRSTLAPVAHGYLNVGAAYVHLGRWTLKAPPRAACQW